MDINELKFDENGLIPAIVQEEGTGKVLTLAYMNKESLAVTVEKKLTTFFSRSRQKLWLKGETSGNYQHVVSISADCDKDALLVKVKKDGPACHTGADGCFDGGEIMGEADSFSLAQLQSLIAGRKTNAVDGSYTSYLFQKGLDKILKKVGEESTEVIVAAKGGSREETVFEIADLTYHLLVLMTEAGISIDDVRTELSKRHVVDKKVKQETMQ